MRVLIKDKSDDNDDDNESVANDLGVMSEMFFAPATAGLGPCNKACVYRLLALWAAPGMLILDSVTSANRESGVDIRIARGWY